MESREFNALFRLEFLKKRDRWKLVKTSQDAEDEQTADPENKDEGETLLNKAFLDTVPEDPEEPNLPQEQDQPDGHSGLDPPTVQSRTYIWQLPGISKDINQNQTPVNHADESNLEYCSNEDQGESGRTCSYTRTQSFPPPTLIPEGIFDPNLPIDKMFYDKITDLAAEWLHSNKKIDANCAKVPSSSSSSSSSFESFALGATRAPHSTEIEPDAGIGSVVCESEVAGSPKMQYLMGEVARLVGELGHALALVRHDAQPSASGSQAMEYDSGVPAAVAGPSSASPHWGPVLLGGPGADAPGRGRGRLRLALEPPGLPIVRSSGPSAFNY